jgi:hypothetical protein
MRDSLLPGQFPNGITKKIDDEDSSSIVISPIENNDQSETPLMISQYSA